MLRDELVDELGLLRRDVCAVECVCCGNKIYLLSRRGRCRGCKSNIYSIQLRSLTLHNWHRIYIELSAYQLAHLSYSILQCCGHIHATLHKYPFRFSPHVNAHLLHPRISR